MVFVGTTGVHTNSKWNLRKIFYVASLVSVETRGAIHSTKLSGNFGPKLNGSVRSNRKSFEKTGPPFEVVLFSRSDRSGFWFNGSRPRSENGSGFKRSGLKTGVFGLKYGQDLENRVAHSHQEFPGAPPRPRCNAKNPLIAS